MDLHGDEPTAVVVVAEPAPLPPPPSGKLNKTAFKLFKRRRSGGAAMPSIFGVRSSGGGGGKGGKSGGEGGQAAGGGGMMVRSKTHDGLAEVGPLEKGGTKGEPGDGGGEEDHHGPSAAAAASLGAKDDAAAAAAASSPAAAAAAASVGKSHSFFSLLRKNGRPSEGAKGERPKGGGRGGLRGLFSSMRWHHRREKAGMKEEEEEEAGPGQSSQGHTTASRLMPGGSLTASLECVKEETSPPPRPPSTEDPQVARSPSVGEQLLDPQDAESPEKQGVGFFQEMLLATPYLLQGEELARVQPRLEPHRDGEEQKTQEDAAITGCGDIIADQEEDVGVGGGKVGGSDAVGSDKVSPGLNKVGTSKKPPSVVTYQGGGEEMASPEQVGDTSTPGFWEVLSQTEEKPQEETPGRKESPKASKDGSFAQSVQDGSTTVQQAGVSQIPTHHNHKEDQKSREKEPQEAVPSSDEGYWDSTTPGPEEDNASSIQKEVIPRDSYSGDALYDLYAEPDENSATVTSADVTSVTCSKPLSPVTTTCPVKTHTTSLKDSKIPISIKHFTSPHSSHGSDTSNSHHLVHHQPTKSEIPRTKIPVSKVLVHRASYRSLSGTTEEQLENRPGSHMLS